MERKTITDRSPYLTTHPGIKNESGKIPLDKRVPMTYHVLGIGLIQEEKEGNMRINRIKKDDRLNSAYLDLIQFEHNGVTLSIGYGSGHYCDSRDESKKQTETVEIAVWRNGQDMEYINNDSVEGWVPVDKIPDMLGILLSSDQAEKRIAEFLRK